MTLVVSTNNAIFFLIALELMLASYANSLFLSIRKKKHSCRFELFHHYAFKCSAIFGAILTKSWSANFDIFRLSATHISAQLSTVILFLQYWVLERAGLMPFHAWLPDAHPQPPHTFPHLCPE